MKKKKFVAIIWPVIYSVLIIAICISAMMVFHSYYFTAIYVSGTSMSPTLQGASGQPVDYGIIDTHDYAIDNVIKERKRFKIITTHYPFANGSSVDYEGGYVHGKENVISKDASYKIKRVYAFPGECFKFDYHYEDGKPIIDFYVKNNPFTSWDLISPVQIPFSRLYDKVNLNSYKYEHNEPLGSDEIWVMGDNYNVSYDCFKVKQPIYRDNIVGVLVAIEGRCTIKRNDSSDDGTHVSAVCTDRQKYAWPHFY